MQQQLPFSWRLLWVVSGMAQCQAQPRPSMQGMVAACVQTYPAVCCRRAFLTVCKPCSQMEAGLHVCPVVLLVCWFKAVLLLWCPHLHAKVLDPTCQHQL